MGSPVNISLTFAGNRVEGYSDIDREAYYPQGKMEMSTSLPIATYLRSAVLLAVPGIGYSSGDQSIYWFSSYDGEVKQIKISKTGETSVTVPAGTFDVDIVSVSGGTPSQLYYINKLSPEVIKIEIPGTPWSYEKVVSP
jgi:hypothetical protein